VVVDVAGEGFTATGLMVTQRNFLDVYRYQSWGGQDVLPLFTQGQTFMPAAVDLKQVREGGTGGGLCAELECWSYNVCPAWASGRCGSEQVGRCQVSRA
jgi:hypothetical protein